MHALPILRPNSSKVPVDSAKPNDAAPREAGPRPLTVPRGWRRAQIDEALARLPREQRVAIELAYFGGYSQSEIAARLGEPLGTVKTRIRLGLRKLRDIVQAQGLELEVD